MNERTDQQILEQWYAEIYDQEETETDDVECILRLLGPASLHVLEACCGTGRILVPLARAGHRAEGFDMDGAMLSRLPEKAKGLETVSWRQADALAESWGSSYDAVVLAGNILMNLDTTGSYVEAQRLFLRRGADCLRPGGRLILDLNLFAHPEKFFGGGEPRVIFEGTDSHGVTGKFLLVPGGYDPETRMEHSGRRMELSTPEGRLIVQEAESRKHIPSRGQVEAWLAEAGLHILSVEGDYRGNPIGETTCRMVAAAHK